MTTPKLAGRNKMYSALAFLIPFVGMLMVMIISRYKPFGKYSMLYSDMYHQYYPFFVAYRAALRSGDSLLYSWTVGMGIDFLGLVSYYLGSPLNLLSVLVPEQFLLSYFSLIMPIKLGFAGLFFSVFLRKIFDRNDFSISVFGAFYALCAWALGFQWNVMWLDTFALLPLVILGEISLLRDGKFFLYTVALFFAVFINYYIGLFVCYFVALVFFCYEICRFGGWKKFFADLGKMALFSAMAIGMTAILEIPTFAALQTTQSSVNAFPHGLRLNIAKENTLLGLLDAMRQVAGNMGGSLEPNFKEGLPNLYCGVGTVVLALLYLMSNKIRLRDKLCAVALLLFFMLSFIVRQLDYVWHGFHFPNMIPYRFSFLFSFVLLYMAYCAWNVRRSFQPFQLCAACLFAAALLCLSDQLVKTVDVAFWGISLKIPVYLLYNLVFLNLYMATVFYGMYRENLRQDAEPEEIHEWRVRASQRRLLSREMVLTVMVMELAATLLSFGLYFPGTNVTNYPRGREEAASMIRYMHEREKYSLFYRAETTHSQTLNDGALNGYNGISAFTSSANVRVTEFMQALGYGAKNTYNRYCFEESSPVANLFLDLKYMIEREGRDRSSTYFEDVHHFGNVHLLQNKAYLPLGFLTETPLADVDFKDASSEFALQNTIFSAATGVDANVWYRLPEQSVSIVGDGTSLSELTGFSCKYYDTGSNAAVVYTFRVDQPGFMCIHLDFPKRNEFTVDINGIEVYKENISLPQMLAVGDVQDGDQVNIRITCKSGDSAKLTVTGAILQEELFRDGYEQLAASQMELISFSNTRVRGTIDCNRDGLLYTSVPQNGNWHVQVDGKPAQIRLVGDCMISTELTQGVHQVELYYHNSAFALGWKISLACAAVFLGLSWWVYKPDWRRFLKK